MPPKRSTAGAGSAPAATSSAGRTTKRAAGLAQPLLSFQSRKPTGSPRKGAKGRVTAPSALGRTNSAASNTSTVIDQSGEDDEDEGEAIESDVEEEEKVLGEKKQKQDVVKAAAASLSKVKADIEVEQGPKEHLNVKDKRWNAIYKDAVVQMGGQKPIHAGPDTHNNVHHILRVFDMTSKYGPYIGVSRLQRWERAKKWGLNPPEEIRMILTTVEGENDPEYRENVLHTWLG